MYKATARNEQFMTRSGSFSTHGSRTGKDLLNFVLAEEMNLKQQREAVYAARQQCERDLTEVNRQLKRQYSMPQEEANILRRNRLKILARMDDLVEEKRRLGKIKVQSWTTKRPLSDFIADIVKERMTKPEWVALLAEAEERSKIFDGVWPNEEQIAAVNEAMDAIENLPTEKK